ncbi:MAG: hypothetical protein ABSG90_02405 [Dehalococcoidia bacterium]|jgi:hypothetical protein
MVTQIKNFDKPSVADDWWSSRSNLEMAHVLSQYVMPALFTEHQIIALGTLRDGRLRVVAPFKVAFTYDKDQVVAEATEISEFGFGNNFTEALIDLQRTVSELYFTLDSEQERLGPDLQKVWSVLRQKISKR